MTTPREQSPWLAGLSEGSITAITNGVADWPDLTERQRDKLRPLLRPRQARIGGGDGAT
jgi:hypothetical protein